MKQKCLLIFFLFLLKAGMSQTSSVTLTLKIENLRKDYAVCHWVGYDEILYGTDILIPDSASALQNRRYKIYVRCPSYLNKLPKSTFSTYKVTLLERHVKDVFAKEEESEKEYTLLFISPAN